MRKRPPFTLSFIFILFTVCSCTKLDLKKDKTFEMDKASVLLSSAAFIPQDGDSIERITVLGAQLTNAYLIPNMTQAYHNLAYSMCQ